MADVEQRFASGPWRCSGLARVTDPTSSKRDMGGTDGVISGVIRGLAGLWLSLAAVSPKRVLALTTWAEDTPIPDEDTVWTPAGFTVGVAGQCGVFDEGAYPEDDTGELEDLASLYGACNAVTLCDRFGVVRVRGDPRGTVCLSGDGVFPVHCRLDGDGVATAIRVRFPRRRGPSPVAPAGVSPVKAA